MTPDPEPREERPCEHKAVESTLVKQGWFRRVREVNVWCLDCGERLPDA